MALTSLECQSNCWSNARVQQSGQGQHFDIGKGSALGLMVPTRKWFSTEGEEHDGETKSLRGRKSKDKTNFRVSLRFCFFSLERLYVVDCLSKQVIGNKFDYDLKCPVQVYTKKKNAML